MATYDGNNSGRTEVIGVNPRNRQSMQHVELLNPHNVYKGQFQGSVDITNIASLAAQINALSSANIQSKRISAKSLVVDGTDFSQITNNVSNTTVSCDNLLSLLTQVSVILDTRISGVVDAIVKRVDSI